MQQTINVRQARQNISRLLDAISAGDEYVITRRDMPVAKLTKITAKDIETLRFPDRSEFRSQLPKCHTAGSYLVSEMRNERG